MTKIIKRKLYLKSINREFEVHPVVAILGPRQCGKTSLARDFLAGKESFHFFDLENPRDLAKLDDPMLALEHLNGIIVIDEIQRKEDLFPVLRVLVDQNKEKRKFLILGSASRDLIKQSSESLAGRIAYLELTPFTLKEVEPKNHRSHWARGGFPLSFLSKNEQNSLRWRDSFISTFLERDIPNLGINIPAKTLRRFWTMLAHFHGQVVNFSQIANSIQSTDTTVRRYLEILEGTYMVRVLQPWYENIKKRQVKSPKIYIRDSGILHALLGVKDERELLGHPKCGASWEGYCLEEMARRLSGVEKYFWGTHGGAELDLLIMTGGKKKGFEFKFSSSPKVTKSMKAAIETLNLSELTVIIPGKEEYPLAKNVSVVGIEQIVSDIS